jgi:hypothetical protein
MNGMFDAITNFQTAYSQYCWLLMIRAQCDASEACDSLLIQIGICSLGVCFWARTVAGISVAGTTLPETDFARSA